MSLPINSSPTSIAGSGYSTGSDSVSGGVVSTIKYQDTTAGGGLTQTFSNSTTSSANALSSNPILSAPDYALAARANQTTLDSAIDSVEKQANLASKAYDQAVVAKDASGVQKAASDSEAAAAAAEKNLGAVETAAKEARNIANNAKKAADDALNYLWSLPNPTKEQQFKTGQLVVNASEAESLATAAEEALAGAKNDVAGAKDLAMRNTQAIDDQKKVDAKKAGYLKKAAEYDNLYQTYRLPTSAPNSPVTYAETEKRLAFKAIADSYKDGAALLTDSGLTQCKAERMVNQILAEHIAEGKPPLSTADALLIKGFLGGISPITIDDNYLKTKGLLGTALSVMNELKDRAQNDPLALISISKKQGMSLRGAITLDKNTYAQMLTQQFLKDFCNQISDSLYVGGYPQSLMDEFIKKLQDPNYQMVMPKLTPAATAGTLQTMDNILYTAKFTTMQNTRELAASAFLPNIIEDANGRINQIGIDNIQPWMTATATQPRVQSQFIKGLTTRLNTLALPQKDKDDLLAYVQGKKKESDLSPAAKAKLSNVKSLYNQELKAQGFVTRTVKPGLITEAYNTALVDKMGIKFGAFSTTSAVVASQATAALKAEAIEFGKTSVVYIDKTITKIKKLIAELGTPSLIDFMKKIAAALRNVKQMIMEMQMMETEKGQEVSKAKRENQLEQTAFESKKSEQINVKQKEVAEKAEKSSTWGQVAQVASTVGKCLAIAAIAVAVGVTGGMAAAVAAPLMVLLVVSLADDIVKYATAEKGQMTGKGMIQMGMEALDEATDNKALKYALKGAIVALIIASCVATGPMGFAMGMMAFGTAGLGFIKDTGLVQDVVGEAVSDKQKAQEIANYVFIAISAVCIVASLGAAYANMGQAAQSAGVALEAWQKSLPIAVGLLQLANGVVSGVAGGLASLSQKDALEGKAAIKKLEGELDAAKELYRTLMKLMQKVIEALMGDVKAFNDDLKSVQEQTGDLYKKMSAVVSQATSV